MFDLRPKVRERKLQLKKRLFFITFINKAWIRLQFVLLLLSFRRFYLSNLFVLFNITYNGQFRYLRLDMKNLVFRGNILSSKLHYIFKWEMFWFYLRRNFVSIYLLTELQQKRNGANNTIMCLYFSLGATVKCVFQKNHFYYRSSLKKAYSAICSFRYLLLKNFPLIIYLTLKGIFPTWVK